MTTRGLSKFVKAIRNISESGRPITSLALAEELKIRETDRSRALDVAAGWISTLRRYGFLKIAKGVKVKGPRRSLQVYTITGWGIRFKTRKTAKPASRVAANPSGNQG